MEPLSDGGRHHGSLYNLRLSVERDRVLRGSTVERQLLLAAWNLFVGPVGHLVLIRYLKTLQLFWVCF